MLGLKPSLPDMQQVNSIDLENQKSQNNSIRLQAHPELKEPVLYQPKSLKPEFQNLIGSYYHPLLGEMIISIKNRRSCQTLEVYESLYVKIGKLGTGWIENLAFYDSGLINEKYMYPLSIDPTENEQCCVGIRCNEVQKIIPGVYPLVKDNDDLALDSWTDVDFIWNSSVWYVSDYSPVFSFEKNSSGEFTIVFRRGSWTSESYSFTRNHDNDFKWTDKCNLNSE
ncbi:Oidioi.mRNA.OKI2018_I69.chr2.g7908.t1.cds [Oikopleura dioica]|uniref:Oidioi.mRNA.OKI2018_I69.chr2.g7908.t1.cds n=1 Tax=Oikopleura dioica TaxID=34765 RepID=A0ABN7TE03_OIKDI|nr:Oidioi.mRNA.OKI2018_I69.chr2.g7908.t1.cds [Oikopleura dioica]